MSYESERLKILEMIDNGLITVDEGVALLKSLDQRGVESPALPETPEPPASTDELVFKNDKVVADEPPQASQPPAKEVGDQESLSADIPSTESVHSQAEFAQDVPGEQQPAEETVHAPQPESAPQEKFTGPQIDPGMTKWRRFWWIPLWVGVGITVISASLMYVAWSKGGFGFWFACTWFPFALGVLVMALAYSSRTARWLHVRVHQKPGERPQNISISMPIPLRLTAWFFRTFKGRIPHMENTGIDELIMALEKTNPDTPFYVEVNEGENGERVEVYIG